MAGPPRAGPAAALALHRALQRGWRNPPGWRSLSAVNHTTVGLRFIATALVFFLLGGVLAMLLRAQLAAPGAGFLDAPLYNQIFTMHGTVMMFLFAIPMLEGYALYLLPKMLGARDLAYPRLGAYAYWCYLFGGLILVGGLAAGVAPDAGWFMYTPLSSATYSPGINSDIWLIGVTFSEISAVCGAVELVVTILTQRTAGMSLARMPVFAWYVLAAAAMILVGFPPLILGSILLELERALGWAFFDPTRGGDPLLWQHLFWMFGHPEVYIIFLPAAGVVSTLVPVFARHPLVGYGWVVGSAVVLAVLSFALWAHHMFVAGIARPAQTFFSVASMLIALPTAVQFFAWIATLWAGRPVWRLPMLYLAGFLAVFVAGGLTGVMLALVPFNQQAHDTHFVVAHLHYVLVGGMVFPLLAGVYYWMPHVTGRMPSERLGAWGFWLIFAGFNATFLVMHLTGLMGMPRRIHTYDDGLGWAGPNLLSSVGGFVMAAGFAVLLLDVFLHARVGRIAPRNPWGAGTLEWAMATPPPAYNIASQPRVQGRDPLWDEPALAAQMAAGRHYLGRAAQGGGRETLGVDMLTGEPTHRVQLPGPSWLPLIAALATGGFFLAVLFKSYWLAAAGALAALALFLRWAWQGGSQGDDGAAGRLPALPARGGPGSAAAGDAPQAGADLPQAWEGLPQACAGCDLPPHHVCRNAPGWWGTVYALVADGTVLASLLFGYVYLWVITPGWRPPDSLPAGAAPAMAAAAPALAAAAAAAHFAWRAAAGGRRDGGRASAGEGEGGRHGKGGGQAGAPQRTAACAAWLAGACVAGLAAAAALSALAASLPPATVHAYGAITRALAGYAVLHAALGAVMAGYVACRARAGFVSAERSLEPRVTRLWWMYSAVSGLAVLAALWLPMA